MKDTIYRQDAIDAIKHAEVHFTVKSTIDFSAHKKAVHEIIYHILDAQERALGELPSAEPKIIYCQECIKADLCAWRREGAEYCSFAERRTDERFDK